jgi:hypothetical protein
MRVIHLLFKKMGCPDKPGNDEVKRSGSPSKIAH